MKRQATATWSGGLKEGKGALNTPSGVLRETPYSFAMRFETAPGTNPEELIAAAHSGCYSMALSGAIEKAGVKANRIETIATVTLEKDAAGFSVTGIHLDVTADVPGMSPADFAKAAEETKKGCPISRLLEPGTKITLDARLATGART